MVLNLKLGHGEDASKNTVAGWPLKLKTFIINNQEFGN